MYGKVMWDIYISEEANSVQNGVQVYYAKYVFRAYMVQFVAPASV